MHTYVAIFTFVFKGKRKSFVSFVHIHSSYLVNGTQVSKILISLKTFSHAALQDASLWCFTCVNSCQPRSSERGNSPQSGLTIT